MKAFNAILKEMALAGVPKRIRHSAEARSLRDILEADEIVIGCLQGLYNEGLGIIVATTNRLLIINKSFLWMRLDDKSYATINSIKYKKGIFFGKVVLSSRGRRYIFHVLNSDPIGSFVTVIDNKMRFHGQLNQQINN